MNSFDISKCQKDANGHLLCQTRDGRKARIVCTDANRKSFVFISLITQPDGLEMLETHTIEGSSGCSAPHINDLINIHETLECDGWENVYKFNGLVATAWYSTKEAADLCAGTTRFACIPHKLKCTKGEGL